MVQSVKKIIILISLFMALCPAASRALAPAVEGSSEDLFWSDPMTVHNFKDPKDLHNIGVSILSIMELEFVRLGDGLIDLSLRSQERPISKSLDSLDYAYHELPQVKPVRRVAELFDALQLRQISLSDARAIQSFISVQKVGGVTPIMQTRIYKVVVYVEDLIEDADSLILWPVNESISRIRKEPVRVKTLSYAADGIGYGRWKVYSGVRFVNKKIVTLTSRLIRKVEAPHDAWIRTQRTRANARHLIYARMPEDVYQNHKKYLVGKGKQSVAGTIDVWYQLVREGDRNRLSEEVQTMERDLDHHRKEDWADAKVVAAEYKTWEGVPLELKKYVVGRDEVAQYLREYHSKQGGQPYAACISVCPEPSESAMLLPEVGVPKMKEMKS